MLLRCFEADTGEPIRFACPKILNFSLITIVALPFLNLLIYSSLMLGPIVSTLVSEINISSWATSLVVRVKLIPLATSGFSALPACRDPL